MGNKPIPTLHTQRLQLRPLTLADAPFLLGLLNEPSFIQNIGDRGVRTVAQAELYLSNGALASYAKNGFGLFLVQLSETGQAIGICGLIRREGLDAPDIGYAYLPAFWNKGYALEAARAVLGHAAASLHIRRVVAIAAPDNHGSIRVLEKAGLRFVRQFLFNEQETALYEVELPGGLDSTGI